MRKRLVVWLAAMAVRIGAGLQGWGRGRLHGPDLMPQKQALNLLLKRYHYMADILRETHPTVHQVSDAQIEELQNLADICAPTSGFYAVSMEGMVALCEAETLLQTIADGGHPSPASIVRTLQEMEKAMETIQKNYVSCYSSWSRNS